MLLRDRARGFGLGGRLGVVALSQCREGAHPADLRAADRISRRNGQPVRAIQFLPGEGDLALLDSELGPPRDRQRPEPHVLQHLGMADCLGGGALRFVQIRALSEVNARL